MIVRLHEVATLEYDDAIAWYAARDIDVALRSMRRSVWRSSGSPSFR